jgi:hypothetical protein
MRRGYRDVLLLAALTCSLLLNIGAAFRVNQLTTPRPDKISGW